MPWLRGSAEAARPGERDLAPIRIFTEEIELNGFVAPAGQRVTDILLRGLDVPFLPAGAAPRPENWIRISPADILFVAPPPLAGRTAWREARDRRTVSVRVGRYRVHGTAHVARGAPGSAPIRQAFLPLTDAVVGDERFRVVIVNVTRATLES